MFILTGFEIHTLLPSFKNQKKYKYTQKEFLKPINHKYLHLGSTITMKLLHVTITRCTKIFCVRDIRG